MPYFALAAETAAVFAAAGGLELVVVVGARKDAQVLWVEVSLLVYLDAFCRRSDHGAGQGRI